MPDLEQAILAGKNPALHILLVDDNAFNRQGMALYLQGEGLLVQECGDEEAARQLAEAQAFDAAVIDISIPPDAHTAPRPEHNFGIRLAHHLKQSHPNLGIVLFSAYEDRGAEVLDMVRDGVRGVAYKLKGCQPRALLQAIHEVIAGRVLIDPEVHANRPALADELLDHLASEERSWVQYALQVFGQLTPREVEIAQRVAASHNTQGIARALSITPKSVENYIARIYDKLGLNEMAPDTDLRKVVLLAKVCMIHDLRAGGS